MLAYCELRNSSSLVFYSSWRSQLNVSLRTDSYFYKAGGKKIKANMEPIISEVEQSVDRPIAFLIPQMVRHFSP